ncbi:hypothetical protein D3C76_1848310 [compost metagenome]
MSGADHGPQQVEVKTGMLLIGFAWVVGPAVMAFGEYGYGVHMSLPEHGLELLTGEVPPNGRN